MQKIDEQKELKTLQEAEEELNIAHKKYCEASTVEDSASRDQTAALNALNHAQRTFDTVVNSMKEKTSVWNSEWWNKKRRNKNEARRC